MDEYFDYFDRIDLIILTVITLYEIFIYKELSNKLFYKIITLFYNVKIFKDFIISGNIIGLFFNAFFIRGMLKACAEIAFGLDELADF